MKMILFHVSLALFSSPLALAELPPWVMHEGEQRFWNLPNLARFSLNGSAVRGKSLEGGLLLKAVHPGKASLVVMQTPPVPSPLGERSIVVLKSDPESKNLPHRLEQALSILETTEVIVFPRSSPGGLTGDRRGFLLRGETTHLEEARRIHRLVTEYPDQLVNETNPAPTLLAKVEVEVNAWLKADPELARTLWTEYLGQSLWLRGHLTGKTRAEEIRRQLASQWPVLHLDLSQDGEQTRTVAFRVYLLEIKRQALRDLGLSWPSETSLANYRSFDLNLKHLEARGAARVLSEPELVVRAPGEAELFSGGQIPIRASSQFFSEVSWKNHGLSLKIQVGRIIGRNARLTIHAETSHLTLKETDETIPSLASNRIKTEVDARFGEHLLISGLLKQSTQDQTKRLPFLAEIPLIGDLLTPLFGSEVVETEQLELVAVLLPSLNLPEEPLRRITHHVPTGRLPLVALSQRTLNLDEEAELRQSPDFPWVAF